MVFLNQESLKNTLETEYKYSVWLIKVCVKTNKHEQTGRGGRVAGSCDGPDPRACSERLGEFYWVHDCVVVLTEGKQDELAQLCLPLHSGLTVSGWKHADPCDLATPNQGALLPDPHEENKTQKTTLLP